MRNLLFVLHTRLTSAKVLLPLAKPSPHNVTFSKSHTLLSRWQYMEASLAEVTLELLRRREELSVRRRRYLDHEQRTSVARHSRLMWACPPTGH